MKPLIVSCNLTVDGFMSGPDNSLEFILELAEKFGSIADSIVVGRQTFLDMAAYWPAVDSKMAAWLNNTPKLVLSTDRNLDVGAWKNANVAVGDGVEHIRAPPGRYPIQKAVAKFGNVGFGPPDPGLQLNGDEWLKKLGALPLLAQPGADFLYTAGSNIQGVLVARSTGKPLSRFFDERIFGPLGMKDSGFFVPPPKVDRLVTAYREQPLWRAIPTQ